MTATTHAIELARAAAAAAEDKKAENIVALDVSQQLPLTDIFVLASASNERLVGAIADAIEEALHGLGAKVIAREGHREGRWIVLNFADIYVHVMHDEERVYYDLERLYKDCPVVELAA
ncbi:ribosome silencing factor [Demequina sp. NBRC 110057]|uniref:ribosome silencing factor n=1 Tax=Demequina sp. NBRC 110057 TaxID=1570346 RepID=UPI000A05E02C|nr:ribosome silencing factor [Demequina sp. NBRC 110057]